MMNREGCFTVKKLSVVFLTFSLFLVCSCDGMNTKKVMRMEHNPAPKQCHCTADKNWPGRDFWRSYRTSHTVVRVKVMAQYVGCPRFCKTEEMTRQRRRTGLLIRAYLVYLEELYKGRRQPKYFYLQTYNEDSLCGIKLVTGLRYVLFARDGLAISKAGNFHYGVGVISSCEGNRDVRLLTSNMKKFLSKQRK